MTAVPFSGTAPFALSELDNALTAVGQTVEDAFSEVIALAQLAERRGYHRSGCRSTTPCQLRRRPRRN